MPHLLQPVPSHFAATLSAGLAEINAQHAIAREDFAFVEETDGNTIGGITASVSFSVLFIGNIWVDAAHRNRGLGQALITAAEGHARSLGARLACVDTLSTQAPGFYLSLGYEEFGRIIGASQNAPVDRIWFRKTLSSIE